jgi:hypothetical protein
MTRRDNCHRSRLIHKFEAGELFAIDLRLSFSFANIWTLSLSVDPT